MRPRLTPLLLAAPLLAAPLLAQTAPPAQDRAAALKASLAENQAALRTYAWVETTQISLDGEVKKTEQKQCYYGADGKVQKTPVPGAAAAPAPDRGGDSRRGGRLKQTIVENKVEDMKEYIAKVVALVHEYVPPDAKKIQAAQGAGSVTAPSGTQPLTVKNYLKTGDLVSIGFNADTKKLTSYTVSSYVEKPKEDDVALAVTFGALQDGTRYPQQVVLDIKAKKMQIKITNSGHKKAGA